jgi:hypothetical protein
VATFAEVLAKPEQPTKFIPDSQAPLHAIWHFEHDATKDPAKVSKLTCLSRGMGNGRMTVRYWRLRWGGDGQLLSADIVNERLKVIDRAKLLKRASP